MPPALQRALTAEERAAIVLAVQSTFSRLRELHQRVQPMFETAGFEPASATAMVHDLPQTIEQAILQHCPSFSRQPGRPLQRDGRDFEIRVAKDSGLTIARSKIVDGENYLVVNYRENAQVAGVWVLWDARDHYFSSKRSNSHARTLLMQLSASQIEVLQFSPRMVAAHARPASMAKAGLAGRRRSRRITTG